MRHKGDTKDLCLNILYAESEAAVQAVLEGNPLMADMQNWKPLDDRETNFNVTSNQASDGGKALTELMTNMVDAVLMRHAFEQGIDPKGPTAPKTMYEAIDKLIKPLKGGKLVTLDPNDPWLRDFAQKNLVIGVSGAKTKAKGLPCYTFADNGEGQSPEKFPKTFLSLSQGNKKDIDFVQGKYNMGSSGVLSYCGTRWFKLILSRRFDKKGPWGWTLVRRRPSDAHSMPVAEYFVMPDGSIPFFAADEIYPMQTGTGQKYDRMHLASGTIIKLYDYQAGSSFSGFKGAREALNENLVETMLPFRLLDLRQKPDASRGPDRAQGVDPRPFYGMEYLLVRSHREDQHDTEEDEAAGSEVQAVASIEDPKLGKVTIKAIPLKRNLPGWLKSSNNRVFHAVNGQVQFKQTRGYLSASCQLPALKDRVIVVVDASELTFATHNDLWKGDREHIRATGTGQYYKDKVTEAIKASEVLKAMQAAVAKEELERASTTERDDLFQKLVDADPQLANLLNDRSPTIRVKSSGGSAGGEAGAGKFEGKYSPTFLRAEERVRDGGLSIPINKTRPVAARTDAENGYLQRSDNRGHLIIDDEIRSRFSIRSQLFDGRLTVFLTPIEGQVQVGDTFECGITLHDDAMPEALSVTIAVTVVDEEKEPAPPRKGIAKAKNGNGGKNSGSEDEVPNRGLPPFVLLTHDGRQIDAKTESEQWPEDFSQEEGGFVVDLGEGNLLYKINYDNAYHLKYKAEQRGDVAKSVVSEKYILGMRIIMMGYEQALRSKGSNGQEAEWSEHKDVFRLLAAKAAASTILALAEYLPKIVDSTALTQIVE